MTIPTSSAVTELERLRDLIGMGLPHYLVPATTTTRRLDIECVPYVELRDAINDRLAVLRAQPTRARLPRTAASPQEIPVPDRDYTAQAGHLAQRIRGALSPSPVLPHDMAIMRKMIATALTAAHQAGARQALEGVRDARPVSDWVGSASWGKGYAEGVADYYDVIDAHLAQLPPPPDTPEDQG